MAVKRKYRLNLRNYGNLPAIMLSQYDEGYALEFEIRDGTDAASDLSAYTVTLKGTRADTLAYSFAGTVSTNVLTFVIDTTMTACAGRGTAEIAIKDTANDVLFATFNMPVFVERAAVPEGSIDADVERAQEIAEQIQEIVDTAAATVSGAAEKWATGQIDGTDVPSTDPTYENNAKYYAEQAADSAASIGIDATLTQAGKAADAKKTGDEITALKEDLRDIQTDMGVLHYDVQSPTKINGKFINGNGVISDVANNAYKVTDYIDVSGYYQAIITGSAGSSNMIYAFYDNDKAFIIGALGNDGAQTVTVTIPNNVKYLVISNDSNAVSACTLTKWTYPYIQDFQTGHREYTATWEQGNLNTQGAEVYNAYPARTVGYLSTDDYDFVSRDTTYAEAFIFYYTYDSNNQTYTFVNYQTITPSVNHVIDKTYSHFRLKLFQSWSSAVDLTVAKSSFKLYKYISVAEHPKWFGKKWTAIGDSLTEVNSTATAKYHDLISQQTGITVVNLGDGGTGYKSTDGGAGDSFMDRVANVPLDSDVITIFGSGNDLGSENEIGTPTDTGTTTLCGCINTTIDNLLTRIPLANLGIVTPTPWQQYNPANDQNKMALYAAVIVEICRNRGIPCLDLYHCSGLRPWDTTFKSLAYANADGVHPNNIGHALIAPKFQAFLDSLLIH